jgi:hypothetical protein
VNPWKLFGKLFKSNTEIPYPMELCDNHKECKLVLLMEEKLFMASWFVKHFLAEKYLRFGSERSL